MDIKIFENKEFGQIRTLNIDKEIWFVGKDVAIALGYTKPLNALATHVDKDDSLKKGLIDSIGRMQEMIIINESGLYSLILSSKLESARRFKRWVASEVLPSIRQNGVYILPEVKTSCMPRRLTSDDYLKAATLTANCRNERLPYVLFFLEKGGFEVPSPEVKRISWNLKTEWDL